jgi:hypothetical protein
MAQPKAYPVGRWIDQGHERAVMTGGSILIGACLLLHSAIDSVAGFYAVWIALGAGLAATLYTPVFAVVTRRFPEDFLARHHHAHVPGRPGQHGVQFPCRRG